jgi:hypothetical protein
MPDENIYLIKIELYFRELSFWLQPKIEVRLLCTPFGLSLMNWTVSGRKKITVFTCVGKLLINRQKAHRRRKPGLVTEYFENQKL